MGLFDFAANIGRKLFGNEKEAAGKIKEHIDADNPNPDKIFVGQKIRIPKEM